METDNGHERETTPSLISTNSGDQERREGEKMRDDDDDGWR